MNLFFLNIFVKSFLFPLGMVENVGYKKYGFSFFILFYGLVCYVTFGIIIGLLTTTDIGGKGMQIGQLTTHMTSLAMTLYYKLSMPLVLKLIEKLRRNGYKWSEAGEKMEQFIKTIVLKVFCGYYLSIVFTVMPVFLSIPNTVQISEKYSYLLPFWYYCGENRTNILSVFCWKVDSMYELFISNVVQAVLYAFTLHALIMFLLFYTILTTNVKIHAEMLTNEAKKLAEESNEFAQRMDRGDGRREVIIQFEHIQLKKFDGILKHQQFIRMYRFTEEVTVLLRWMVMINMIGIFTSLTITAFFTIVEKTNDSLLASKMASMSSIMIVTFFIYCYNAQTITDLNQSILDGMLDIPWFHRNIKFRRKYAIALSLNQKPLNVKACGMYVVNLRMFQSFMRGIYSVLNLMLLKYS